MVLIFTENLGKKKEKTINEILEKFKSGLIFNAELERELILWSLNKFTCIKCAKEHFLTVIKLII